MDPVQRLSLSAVSRRSLLVAGTSLGLSSVVGAAPNQEPTIDAKEVADALNCCQGVTDLILLVRLKPCLSDLYRSARELLPSLQPLAEKTHALSERLTSSTASSETLRLVEATAESTRQAQGSVQDLTESLKLMLDNGLADGQTAESMRLFVAKTLNVAYLMQQVARSLVSVRVSLESRGVHTPEFNEFVQGKLTAWQSISVFLNDARILEKDSKSLQEEAAANKEGLRSVLQELTKATPNLEDARARAREIYAPMGVDDLEGYERLSKADREILKGAIALCSRMIDQIGKAEDDPTLYASLDVEDAASLRERVRKALRTASNGQVSWIQEGIVTIAARTAGVATDRSGRLNIVATAILAMVPNLPFVKRTFGRALEIAGEIV